MVSREMPENREEKGTNPDSGMVLSGMDSPAEIWPERCGDDYRSQLAPPKDWNVAVTICQMRAGCDIGGMGRAVLADMPMRASRIGTEGGVSFPEGDDREGWEGLCAGKYGAGDAMSRKTFTICSCIGICAVQGALMFVSPLSPIYDLISAISFGVCGVVIGQITE